MEAKGCRISWVQENEVRISGVVDEYADFNELGKSSQKTLRVDFSEVSRVNSSGIRAWIQLILKYKIRLRLHHCSPAIVDQFSMIPEFLGKNGFVESFYANYLCGSCAYEEKKFFEQGKDFEPGVEQVKAPLSYECPRCHGNLELDHNPEVYFAFLRLIKAP